MRYLHAIITATTAAAALIAPIAIPASSALEYWPGDEGGGLGTLEAVTVEPLALEELGLGRGRVLVAGPVFAGLLVVGLIIVELTNVGLVDAGLTEVGMIEVGLIVVELKGGGMLLLPLSVVVLGVELANVVGRVSIEGPRSALDRD
jgi:hypothetical protein